MKTPNFDRGSKAQKYRNINRKKKVEKNGEKIFRKIKLKVRITKKEKEREQER